mmetsp:Transcript_40857/g.79561  ORF Transcript_40857/g.79561 Transcript_40857/m.79561 type:complete len:275 (-) Transcript_40857:418-1242(-)
MTELTSAMSSALACDQCHNLLPLMAKVPQDGTFDDVEKGLEAKSEVSEEFEALLNDYSDIKKKLSSMQATNTELVTSIERFDRVVHQEERDKLVSTVEPLVRKTRVSAQSIKTKLAEIKTSNDAYSRAAEPGAIQAAIRENMYIYFMKKYYKLQKQYSQLANDFRRKVHERAKRELKLVATKPLTDAEVDNIIEQGNDQKLLEAMLQGQDQQELDRLAKRADAVNQINREVRNLLQMYQDMAALVDAQQETVDSIVTCIECMNCIHPHARKLGS